MNRKAIHLGGLAASLLIQLGVAAQARPGDGGNGNFGGNGGGPGMNGGPGGGPGGNGGFGGNRRNNNNALIEVKTQIKSTDEEWKVIGPKLQAVVSARQAVESSLNTDNPQGGFGGPGGGRGGPGGGGGRGGNDSFGGPSDQRTGGRGGPGGGGPGGGPGGGGQGGGFGPGGDGGGMGPGGGGPPRGFDGGPPMDGMGGDPQRRPEANASTTQPSTNAAIVGGAQGDAGGPRGNRGFGGRGGGPGGGGPGGGNNPVLEAMTGLQTVIADPKATEDDLAQKVEAVRAAKAKAQVALNAAVKDLLPLLTNDQHAMLVALGYLD